jgi:hypothetical protein
MKNSITLKLSASVVLDILAVLFIIFLGDISRLIGYPIYILDPMRMMVVLAIAFTPRWNGWALALLLPFISYYFGGHPHLLKTCLMATELLLNVWLFWFLFSKIRMSLISILLSIIISKAVYYLLKYICIQQGWISGDLVSTPLDIQMITTIIFSAFIFTVFLFMGKLKKL